MKNVYYFLNQVGLNIDSLSIAVKNWEKANANTSNKSLYWNKDECLLLEIALFSNLQEVNNDWITQQRNAYENAINPMTLSDWRKQIIHLKEDVISSASHYLPSTPYLQMRYIEVPMSIHAEYLQWREHTIFKHVKQYSEIELFLACHSVFSTTPGITFLSGFSCNKDKYLDIFACEAFQKIAKEAAEKYICSGRIGLSTKIFELVSTP